MVPYTHGTIRAVTHYGVERADVDATIVAVREALAATVGTVRRPGRPPRRPPGAGRRRGPSAPGRLSRPAAACS